MSERSKQIQDEMKSVLNALNAKRRLLAVTMSEDRKAQLQKEIHDLEIDYEDLQEKLLFAFGRTDNGRRVGR